MRERSAISLKPEDVMRFTAIQVVADQQPQPVDLGKSRNVMGLIEAEQVLRTQAEEVRREYLSLVSRYRRDFGRNGHVEDVEALRERITQLQIVDVRVPEIGISSLG